MTAYFIGMKYNAFEAADKKRELYLNALMSPIK
jgi:hypothetical protein